MPSSAALLHVLTDRSRQKSMLALARERTRARAAIFGAALREWVDEPHK
jgi:hypothetical protein